MGLVIVYVECPSWEWQYDLALNSLLLMARATLQVYIFFSPFFGLTIMSRHFSPQDPFGDNSVNNAHPDLAIYEPLSQKFDPSMATVPSIETDPLEATPSDATPLYIIRLDSEASSTRESKVEGCGGGG